MKQSCSMDSISFYKKLISGVSLPILKDKHGAHSPPRSCMSRKWVSLGDSSNALLPFLLKMTESLAPSHSQEEVEGLTESDWTFLGQIPWHCSAGKKTEKRINKPVVPGEWSYLQHTVPLHDTMGQRTSASEIIVVLCFLFVFCSFF